MTLWLLMWRCCGESTSAARTRWRWPTCGRSSPTSGTPTCRPTFRAGTCCSARTRATAIADSLGVSAPGVVLSRDELAEAIAANPFPAEPDPKRVHAVLLSKAPAAEAAGKIDAALERSTAKGAADELAIVGRTLYLHTPDGFGNSELAAAVLRIVTSPRAGVTGTARNWTTMLKLLDLCGGR